VSTPGRTDGPPAIRVVIADDHTLFREGVREMLQCDAGFDVVGEAATGHAAVELAGLHRPDVLLVDVEMPGEGAAATIRGIKQVSPATRVVVLSMHADSDLVRELTAAGASGYLVKNIRRTELVAALTSVASESQMVMWYVPREAMRAAPEPAETLSKRELQVLTLVSDALSNGQIATRLYISEATVKRHLTSIYAKLNARSRLDAVNVARSLGYLKRQPTAEPSAGDPPR
jgi:DNA-binding NarL/FixJ family response regulator